MAPWPTVPVPPTVLRPAALIISCSLSATLICMHAQHVHRIPLKAAMVVLRFLHKCPIDLS